MTPEQIRLVKSSFSSVLPIADQTGVQFYDRLFALDPALRPLFKGDITEQSRMLMRMLATVVNGLDRLETIVPAVRALGVRHAGYGVVDAHYRRSGMRCYGRFSKDSATALLRRSPQPGALP